MAKQIGYAVVGTGPVVERAVLPAFGRAGGDLRLAAIVSSDRARAQTLAQEHRATAYHLDEFRQCLQRDDVQLRQGDMAKSNRVEPRPPVARAAPFQHDVQMLGLARAYHVASGI